MPHQTLTKTGQYPNLVIKPNDNSLHRDYTFFVRVQALGGSEEWFGEHSLSIGCTASSVSFTDSGSLTTSVTVDIGSSTTEVYHFTDPVATREWCVPQSYTILNPDSSAWNEPAKILGDGPVFDLYSTDTDEIIRFRVASNFQNSLVHISAIINVTM